jgi:hypothetical protein
METNDEKIIEKNLELLKRGRGFYYESMMAGSDVSPIVVVHDANRGSLDARIRACMGGSGRGARVMVGMLMHGSNKILWRPEHYEGVNHSYMPYVVPEEFGSNPGDAVLEETFRRHNAQIEN